MIRRLIIALIMVAFVAIPAYASVQNVKVSGSIDSTWVVRDQYDLGFGTTTTSGFYQNLMITQAILRIDADLTDNVSAVIQLINEREWGNEDETVGNNSDDSNADVDIDLAYVELREMLYSPLTVVVGRQVLAYGNQFLIGDSDSNNAALGRLNVVADDLSKRKAFDAVKAVLDYDPLTIDIIAAKVAGRTQLGLRNEDDTNLFGINANWQLQDDFNTEVEAYFFSRLNYDPDDRFTEGAKPDKLYVPGLRVASSPIEGLWTSAEIAWQFGNKTSALTTALTDTRTTADNMQRDALGIQTISTYAIPGDAIAQYNPIISGSYTWVTGDSNPSDTRDTQNFTASEERYTQWDPMFENQGGNTIRNSLFSLTNTHVSEIGIQVTPLEDLTAKLTWAGLWLDKEMDPANLPTWTLGMPDGSSYAEVVVTNEIDIGWELDLDLAYDYTEDVQIGFSAGWFFPGAVFQDVNDEVAKQFLTNVNVNF